MSTYPAGLFPTLYTIDGHRVAVLEECYDASITDELLDATNGQEILDFTIPYNDPKGKLIQNEMQIGFGGSLFRVRTNDGGWDETGLQTRQVHCEAEFYDLGFGDGRTIDSTTHAVSAMAQAVSGTGWAVGTVTSVSGGTFAVSTHTNPLAILRSLPGTFGGELVFDNVHQVVSLVAIRGDQSGEITYAHGLNLSSGHRIADTTNMYTRVRPTGASGIDISTVNGGIPYLDNYTFYTNQGLPPIVRSTVVNNNDISDPVALLAWGQAQSAALAIPKLTWTNDPATVVGIPFPGIGDKVRVWDRELSVNVFTRVNKRQTYPLEPWRSTVSLNTALYQLTDALTGIVGSTGGTTVGDLSGLGPATPTGITIATAQAVDTTGFAYTFATISWTAVTTNSDGSPIVDLAGYNVEYQIDGGQWTPLGATTRTVVQTPPFHAQASLVARVQALDDSGNASGWDTTTTTAVHDTGAPNTPSSPVLSSRLPLAIEVSWNGLDIGGSLQPSDFARTEVHMSTTSAFAPIGSVINALGSGDASTFETSVGGWQAFGGPGSVARSTAQHHSGTASLVLTATTTAGVLAFSGQTAAGTINPGDSVLATAWVFSTTATSVHVGIDWYGASYISTTNGGNVAIAANTWTKISTVIGPAPAGTTRGDILATWGVAPTAGQQLFIDDCSIIDQNPTLIDNINSPNGGVSVATLLTNGVTYWFGLRAADLSGNISAMSTPVSGKATLIPAGSFATTAIADADIGSVSAGKITVGLLTADITISARIKTANTGARVELNSTGLKAFNSGGTNTVAINNDGSASFTGSINGSTINGGTIIGSVMETAVSGSRVVIAGGGVSTDQIGFWAGSGTAGETPGFINAETPPLGLLISSPSDTANGQPAIIEMLPGTGLPGVAIGVVSVQGAVLEVGNGIAAGSGAVRSTDYVCVHRSATQSVAATTWTSVGYSVTDQQLQDDGVNFASPFTGFQSQAVGFYVAHGNCSWASSVVGQRGQRIVTQGGSILDITVVDFTSQLVTLTTTVSFATALPGGGYSVTSQILSSTATNAVASTTTTPTTMNFCQVA